MKIYSIGELLEIDEEKNIDGLNLPFYGVNINKEFIPTVANTTDIDSHKYKIIRKNMFVYSGMQTGRDVCIRFSLFQDENPVLLSPAYTILKVKDREKVLPEFLFSYFLSSEKDRLGWFYSDSSIRSNLDLDRFFEIKIPLPSIEEQRKYVAAYKGLLNLAEQNEAMIEPLQNACNAYLVKLKEKYAAVTLGDYIEDYDVRNDDNSVTDVRGISVLKKFIVAQSTVNRNDLSKYKIVPSMYIAYVQTTNNEKVFTFSTNKTDHDLVVSSVDKVIYSKYTEILNIEFLDIWFRRSEFDRLARFNSWGSARETFDYSELCRVQIPLPPIEVQQAIVNLYRCAEEARSIAEEARNLLKTVCPAMIQRAAHTINN